MSVISDLCAKIINMGNHKAFLTIKRKEAGYRPVHERITDFGEVEQTLCEEDRMIQASRCMDCGVPFCHWVCPLGIRQSEWQNLVYRGEWRKAYENLCETDDFPEFTGRVCPALCEKACVLNLNGEPVTVRENEVAIIEKAFSEGYVQPRIAAKESGNCVAVIGSGPAGLTCANQLSQMGHTVTVFERDEAPGGLLRLGIPDFKLTKNVIDRRIEVMRRQGVQFVCNTLITDFPEGFDAVCIATGADVPRDLQVEGRQLKGIHFAMDFLKNQNRAVAARWVVDDNDPLSAKFKHVLVIGGGDTGSDCVGTAIRQGAASVVQIEILPKPPATTNPQTPWPYYPNVLKTSSSQEEGCERRWSLATERFVGENGKVYAVEVKSTENGEKETLKADLVLLAMGFIHPKQSKQSGDTLSSSAANVFVAGDAASGASLVVKALASGRKTAKEINKYLSVQKIRQPNK